MNNQGLGIALLIGFGLLGFLLLSSRTDSGVHSQPLKLMPAGSISKQYTNTEVWDIDWNEDGLPKKVTIHRDARES